MADISTEITKIESAVYGEEVRDSICDALQKMNSDLNTAIGTQVIDRATVDAILSSEALSLKYGNYTEVTTQTDLNTFAGSPGNYWIPQSKATTLNNIPVRQSGRLIVFPAKGTGSNDDGGIQLYVSSRNAGTVGMWFRGWKGSTWTNWKKVATNEEILDIKNVINMYNSGNLVPVSHTSKTESGITFYTNGNGSYIVSGTASENVYYNLWTNADGTFPIGLQAGKTYTINYNGNSVVQLQMFEYVNDVLDGSSFLSLSADYSSGYAFTIPADATGILIRLRVTSGTSVGTVTVFPRILTAKSNKTLEEQSDAMLPTLAEASSLAYFNAHNMIPILLDSKSDSGITFTSKQDGRYTVSGTATASTFYNIWTSSNGTFPDGLQAGKSYIVHFNGGGVVQLQMYKYVNGVIASSSFLSLSTDYSSGYNFTIPADATGILIRLRVTSGTAVGTVTVFPYILNTKTNKELEDAIISAKPYPSKPVYYAFGDSLTWGAVWTSDQSTASYQTALENQMPSRIANAIGSTEFHNLGVGGSRFVQQASGDNIIGTLIKNTDLSSADIITIGGGRNDSATSLGNGDTATANDGTICGAVVDIFEYLTSTYPKLQIVMYGVTPQPLASQTGPEYIYTRVFSGGWSLNTYYTEMRKVCARFGVPFIDWYDCTLILQWGVLSGGYSSGTRNWSHPLDDHTYVQMGNCLAGRVASYYTG